MAEFVFQNGFEFVIIPLTFDNRVFSYKEISLSSCQRLSLFQMFVEAVNKAWYVILYPCGHEGELENLWIFVICIMIIFGDIYFDFSVLK